MEHPPTPDHKIADLHTQVLAEIRHRWSPRAYSDREVTVADLYTLFRAGTWAASCYNEQPWRFVMGSRHSSPEAWERVFQCLVPGNQGWAQSAPVLGIVIGKNDFTQTGKPNAYTAYDSGQAMATMALQATHMGLQLHQMGGFDAIKAREQLGIPEGYTPLAAFALGYVGNADQLTEDWTIESETSRRTRKPLEELVFTGTWGEAFS